MTDLVKDIRLYLDISENKWLAILCKLKWIY